MKTKILSFFILTLFIFSCNKNETIKTIEILNKENDSLRTILKEIKNKYIFDSISIRDIPSYKNSYQLNSEVMGEIVFVGFNYNKNSKMNVIMVDSFAYNPSKTLYNPDTLKMVNGGYIYKKKLTSIDTQLKGVLEFENNYGKNYEGLYNTTIRAKK